MSLEFGDDSDLALNGEGGGGNPNFVTDVIDNGGGVSNLPSGDPILFGDPSTPSWWATNNPSPNLAGPGGGDTGVTEQPLQPGDLQWLKQFYNSPTDLVYIDGSVNPLPPDQVKISGGGSDSGGFDLGSFLGKVFGGASGGGASGGGATPAGGGKSGGAGNQAGLLGGGSSSSLLLMVIVLALILRGK